MTDAEKMRKVISELVDTEHTYVRHLSHLMKTYLEPLSEEEDNLFLSSTDVSSLFGNIREIYGFQQKFLDALEEAVESEPLFHQYEAPEQFKVSLCKNMTIAFHKKSPFRLSFRVLV